MGRLWFKLFFLVKSVKHDNDSGKSLIYWIVSTIGDDQVPMVTSHPMLRPMTAYNSKENYAVNPLTNLKSQFSLCLSL